MLLELRLKIRNFFKKHRTVIIVVLIIWLIIIIINYLLGIKKPEGNERSDYKPHDPLLRSDFDVPEKLETPIEDLIDDYVNKCNEGKFGEAYKLISDDCKRYTFNDSEQEYVEYAKGIFNKKKRYTIQDYSNYGSYYIYNIKLIDDILASGLTDQEYAYYEEKIAISGTKGNLKLNVNDYMGHTELKRNGEDDNLKIRIESRDEYYDFEIYTIRITNKTDKDIVLLDTLFENEVFLSAGTDMRLPTNVSVEMHLIPEETRTFKVTFPKFYDESQKADEITFSRIRIMNENYTGFEQTAEEEEEHTEKTYSMSIAIPTQSK